MNWVCGRQLMWKNKSKWPSCQIWEKKKSLKHKMWNFQKPVCKTYTWIMCSRFVISIKERSHCPLTAVLGPFKHTQSAFLSFLILSLASIILLFWAASFCHSIVFTVGLYFMFGNETKVQTLLKKRRDCLSWCDFFFFFIMKCTHCIETSTLHINLLEPFFFSFQNSFHPVQKPLVYFS